MTTLAERMRQAAKRLRTFSASDLADEMAVRTYRERLNVRNYIQDFMKRGEIKRISRGNYCYVARAPRFSIRQRLWNVIRRMPGPEFTLDDLAQLTGANRATIKEFCSWLVRAGHARRIKNGHFRRLGRYEIEVPRDKGKIERLRGIRRKKHGMV